MARRPLTDRQREIASARNLMRERAAIEEAAEYRHTQETDLRATIRAQESIRANRQILSDKTGEYRKRDIESAVVGSVTKPSSANIVLLLIYVFAGLILFYVLVTQATNVQTLSGKVGGWLALLSTDAPLFSKVTKEPT